jgi:RNA polymerase sigma factor (sigma-70 family)
VSPSRGARSEEAAFEVEDAPTPVDPAARKRVAVETFAAHETILRRTALRYSICADDAEEALQRGLEILLNKAPSDDPRELVRWTQTVVKHEALAVRAERERVLAGPAALAPEPGREDWISLIPDELDGPAERAERHEAIERSREALATLKPQELRALTLLAEGYSYREIGEKTGFSPTKVNRCVAEGRERFRQFLVRRDGGARCTELAPLLSAFADGEAGAAEVTTLRDHLRTCAHCRATLRTYRAAPGAAAALLPIVPPARGTLVGRLHDAYAAVATRFGGGAGSSDSAVGGLAATGGTRGAGMAALAKVLAICAGTVGGAACVATGVIPAPLIDPPDHHSAPAAKVTKRPAALDQEEPVAQVPEYTVPPSAEAEPEEGPTGEAPAEHHEKAKPDHAAGEAGEPAGQASRSTPPASENGATEYTEPAPAPVSEPTISSTPSPPPASAPSASVAAEASSGSAAGELGP